MSCNENSWQCPRVMARLYSFRTQPKSLRSGAPIANSNERTNKRGHMDDKNGSQRFALQDLSNGNDPNCTMDLHST